MTEKYDREAMMNLVRAAFGRYYPVDVQKTTTLQLVEENNKEEKE